MVHSAVTRYEASKPGRPCFLARISESCKVLLGKSFHL